MFRTLWLLHRAGYAITGGRLGLRSGSQDRLGTLRLRTVGRRSGRERASMLAYLVDGPDYVVVASNAGSSDAPAWWLNLQERPDAAIDLPDGPRSIHAREADAAERARLWPRIVALEPAFERYAQMAERTIPIVILEPAAGRSDA